MAANPPENDHIRQAGKFHHSNASVPIPRIERNGANSPAIAMECFFKVRWVYELQLPVCKSPKDHWTLKNLSPNNVKTSAGMSRVISMSVTKAPRVRQLKGLQA